MLGFADDAKSEAFVQCSCAAIRPQHLQADGFAKRFRVGKLARDELGTYPATLVFGQQLDADQEDVISCHGGRHGPNRYAVELDDPRMLQHHALSEARALVGVVPAAELSRNDLAVRCVVDALQQRHVINGGGARGDRFRT